MMWWILDDGDTEGDGNGDRDTDMMIDERQTEREKYSKRDGES